MPTAGSRPGAWWGQLIASAMGGGTAGDPRDRFNGGAPSCYPSVERCRNPLLAGDDFVEGGAGHARQASRLAIQRPQGGELVVVAEPGSRKPLRNTAVVQRQVSGSRS